MEEHDRIDDADYAFNLALIQQVKEERTIWDVGDNNYFNKQKSKECWKKIKEILQPADMSCKFLLIN